MTPLPEDPSWFTGIPKQRGRYLVVDNCYWHDRLATWIPPNGNAPGRWYPDGAQPCDETGIAMFRPLPRIPARPDPKLKDDGRMYVPMEDGK